MSARAAGSRLWTANGQVPGGDEVSDEHPGDTEVQAEPGGDLGDGERLRAEQRRCRGTRTAVAAPRPSPARGRDDLRLDLERLVDRTRPAPGEQVGRERAAEPDVAVECVSGFAATPSSVVISAIDPTRTRPRP